MQYFISEDEGGKFVCAREEVKILIDESKIFAEDFLKIVKENQVEPCHMQNVYDDLVN